MLYLPIFYDPTYILVLIGALLSLWASCSFQSTYSKYSNIKSASGITGGNAAKMILANYGITDVQICTGNSDCYNTHTKVLMLTPENCRSSSIASIGVAAHECGHAIQDAERYFPLVLKNTAAPVCAFASNIALWIIIAGMFFSYTLVEVGIMMFSLGVGITLLLLPIEFDASNRALRIITDSGMLKGKELKGAKKVLRSAGMTYVAAAAASILTLLRLLLIFGRRRD